MRIYRIAPGHLTQFVAAWESGVRPLRVARGFSVSAWVADAEDRFIWLLSCKGDRASFEARDRAYYASAERAALDPDPAQWIASSEHLFVDELKGPATQGENPA
jgi:hypothetical protein